MTTSAVPELPDEVKLFWDTNEYSGIKIPNKYILNSLVDSHNQLIRYLRSKQ